MESATSRPDIPRLLRPKVEEALRDTRVVGAAGPRQAGKSTLVQQLVRDRPDATYVSLDDADVRAAVAADPAGFVHGRPGMLAIDEVQRLPDLLLAIKSEVDADQLSESEQVRAPTSFLDSLFAGAVDTEHRSELTKLDYLERAAACTAVSTCSKRSSCSAGCRPGPPTGPSARSGRRRCSAPTRAWSPTCAGWNRPRSCVPRWPRAPTAR